MANYPSTYKLDVTIHIDFPALDLLVKLLEAQQQAAIDKIVARITASTAKTKAAVEANTPPTPTI